MQNRLVARDRRHRRVRKKVRGTAARPRLAVFRSNKHIYAQVIDDVQGVTLASASTAEKSFSGGTGTVDAAKQIGKLVGERAKEAGDGSGADKRAAAGVACAEPAYLRAASRGRTDSSTVFSLPFAPQIAALRDAGRTVLVLWGVRCPRAGPLRHCAAFTHTAPASRSPAMAAEE